MFHDEALAKIWPAAAIPKHICPSDNPVQLAFLVEYYAVDLELSVAFVAETGVWSVRANRVCAVHVERGSMGDAIYNVVARSLLIDRGLYDKGNDVPYARTNRRDESLPGGGTALKPTQEPERRTELHVKPRRELGNTQGS